MGQDLKNKTSGGSSITDWAREKLAVLHHSRPLVKVLMYPAAEQNPYLVVTKRNLEQLGAKVTVVRDLDGAELLSLAPRYDVLHIFNIKEYQSPFSSPEPMLQLRHFSRRVRSLWMARRLGLKLFWTLYNEPKGNYSSEWLERFGRKWMFYQADRIICPSRNTRSLLRERYPDLPEEKVIHIPHHNFGNYFPRQVRKSQARAHLGIAEHGKVFICFGGVHPYKGLTDVIPLFGRHPLSDHTLIVAGSPSNKHYAATIEGLCAQYDNVHAFLRYIPSDEVQYYMQAADIFVMPYKDILNSGSTMLALSFSKPVVAPSIGMIPEVLNSSCSVLFEHSGSQALREAMIKALDLNLERSSNEARRISDSYSAERMTRRLVNAYLDLFPGRDLIPEEAEEL
jgi:glycosyltransferase involved in cell wall biosynthesis